MLVRPLIFAALAAFALSACSSGDPAPIEQTFGASPRLAAPDAQSLPTIKVAEAIGWPEGAQPVAAQGLEVAAFGEALDHPRQMLVLANGDVLVAQSSTRPSPGNSIEARIANWMQGRAGALGNGPGQITLMRDADGDGVVEMQKTLIGQGLNQPYGMAQVGSWLYVANTNALVRYPFTPGQTEIAAAPEKVLDLPYRAEGNGHWTRNLIVSPDGAKLYVAVGSASNIGDFGMEAEEGRAAIWEVDLATSEARVFATGLRNPVGMDFVPETGNLWTVVNERDMLGDDLVPDYMTHVVDGAFYGWPYSYFGQNLDPRITGDAQRPQLVESARVPDYALGAHTASLGLAFYQAALFPAGYRGGAFIGQHGSWNRSVRSGYKVVFVPFASGAPSGPPQDVLTGFLDSQERAMGRPVGVAVDAAGALLVADDVGDRIWRVTPAG
ncbi:MAG: sorbosone dehydrogenase family protein [Alphaproteobacteria bacterium]|nr:sorbosone dehydrogenase family protein [Alphaproteobacteria bacterium]